MTETAWQVTLLKPVIDYLKNLPVEERERILNALDKLQNPAECHIKPLQGRPEWSYRIGRYRALLRVDRDNKHIVVTRVGPRGDVYK